MAVFVTKAVPYSKARKSYYVVMSLVRLVRPPGDVVCFFYSILPMYRRACVSTHIHRTVLYLYTVQCAELYVPCRTVHRSGPKRNRRHVDTSPALPTTTLTALPVPTNDS